MHPSLRSGSWRNQGISSIASVIARAVGLGVVAHAHAAHAIADAVAAGVAGIEHCTFVTDKGVRRDDRTVDAMARAGVFVGCTVAKPRTDMPGCPAREGRFKASPAELPACRRQVRHVGVSGPCL